MLTLTMPKVRWMTIPLGDGQSVELEITPPDHEQLVAAEFQPTAESVIALRLRSVTGWRGVVDEEGQPIPFTSRGLAALLRQFPDSLDKLLDELRPLYKAHTEDERKNLQPPSSTPT